MLPYNNLTRVYMTKIIIRERRVQGTWLSGSKSRCSISSTERVLLIDGKKKTRPKIGAFFEKIWKSVHSIVNIVTTLDNIKDFALILMTWLGW